MEIKIEGTDRKDYYHKWYLKNKKAKIKKSLLWRENLKKKLGIVEFKKWEKEQNNKKLTNK